MKKAFKILWTIVAAIAILLFAVWLLLQTSGVQTFVARKVASSLEDKFHGRIEFSKVYLKPFNAVVIKDFAMLDDDPPLSRSGEVLDTIASASSVVATFSLKGLFKKEGIHLGRVSVSDASFSLVTDSLGSNIQRFFGTGPK
ncbi:MAG: hypothetical protein IJK73_04965, partial [Bacteroidales bacterium]|nr:hypothetical protein [Bacteroidales bacterium]